MTHNRLTIDLNDKQHAFLEQLLDTGLFGDCLGDVAAELIREGIIARIEGGLIKLPEGREADR